jgi:succinyl-diaminopimelate desuccinylase
MPRNTESATLQLTQQLIARPSLTPLDEGCLHIIGQRLEKIGFKLEMIRSGEVDNLWARRGNSGKLVCFAGHTDVVPTGPVDKWLSPPFTPTIRDGMLYGRGAADRKGALAAFVTAIEKFVAAHPKHEGSIALLLTSDEEGVATDGTVRVVETHRTRQMDASWVNPPRQQTSSTIKRWRSSLSSD